MTKRGPLSKTEQQFIFDNASLGVDVLAGKLNRPVEQVKKFVESNLQTKEPERKEAVTQVKKETDTLKLFGRQSTRGKGGVTVMTEAASSRGDITRTKTTPGYMKDSIHRPLGG